MGPPGENGLEGPKVSETIDLAEKPVENLLGFALI